jgi:transcriptional repressor NrdR
MDCPSCKCPDTRVIKSLSDDEDTVTRRRECMSCGLRVTTLERIREPRKKKGDADGVVA